MSKELEALESIREEIAELYGANTEDYSDTNFAIVKQALKTLELIKTKVFDKNNGLQLEKWVHYDGHYSYHINYGMTEEWDVVITKEEYILLNKVIYEKENRD